MSIPSLIPTSTRKVAHTAVGVVVRIIVRRPIPIEQITGPIRITGICKRIESP